MSDDELEYKPRFCVPRENPKWTFEQDGSKWLVYLYGELWGDWKRDEYGFKDYVPFDTKQEALATIEEYEFRGLA